MTDRKAGGRRWNAPRRWPAKADAQLTALWVRQPLPRHADLPGELEGEAEAASDYFEERKEEVAELAKRIRHRHWLREPRRPCRPR